MNGFVGNSHWGERHANETKWRNQLGTLLTQMNKNKHKEGSRVHCDCGEHDQTFPQKKSLTLDSLFR